MWNTVIELDVLTEYYNFSIKHSLGKMFLNVFSLFPFCLFLSFLVNLKYIGW